MSIRKKILFIPALFYLSNPLFISLSRFLKEYETIYLECDYINHKFSNDYDNEIKKIHSFFSKIIIIEDIECGIVDNHFNVKDIIKYYLIKRNINIKIIKTIKEIKPDIIILTSDQTYVYRFILHYFSSIPVLMIQQGSLMPQPRGLEARRLKSKIRYSVLEKLFHYPTFPRNPWRKITVDEVTPFHAYWSKFWVSSEKVQELRNRIFFTGNADMDDNIAYGTERLQKNADYRWDIPRIVYTTQPISEHHGLLKANKLNQLFLDFVNNRKQSKVIVKVHPRDDLNYYKEFFLRTENKQLIIEKDGNLSSMLKEADLLVTGWSMTSYQAVAMGVPVIAMNPENIFDYNKRFPKTGIPVVESDDQFTLTYERLTSRDGLEKFADERIDFLQEINTAADGKSAFRLAILIMDILDGKINS